MKNFLQNKLIALLLAATLSISIKNSGIFYPGAFNDDAKYLLLGEAINSGSYRLNHLVNMYKPAQYPPLYPLIVSIALKFKDPVLTLRIINTIFLIASLYIVFSLIKSVAFYYVTATSLPLILFTNAIMPEIMQLFLVSVLVYIVEKNKEKAPVYAAFLTAMLFYTKSYGIFTVIILCLYLRKIKAVAVYFFLTLIFILPLLLYRKSPYMTEFSLYINFMKHAGIGYYKSIITSFFNYIFNAGSYSIFFLKYKFTSFILLLSLLYSIITMKKLEFRYVYMLMHMFFMSLWVTYDERYLIPVIPFITSAIFSPVKTKPAKVLIIFLVILINAVSLLHIKKNSKFPGYIDFLKKNVSKEDIIFSIDDASIYYHTRARIYDIGIAPNFDRIYIESINYNAKNSYIIFFRSLPVSNIVSDFITSTRYLLFNSLNVKVVKIVYQDGATIFKFEADGKKLYRFKKLNMAKALISENKLEEAKKILQELVKDEETFLGSFLFLLRIYEYEKNFEGIKSISKKAIKYFPEHPEIIYFYSSKLPELEKALKNAIAANETGLSRKIKEKIEKLKSHQ